MKSNRKIGLDGKIFISACLREGTPFAFLLMVGGFVSAIADIWKLSGASGAQMSSFTVTLLLYDFIVSLLLVAAMFYAYFLECGTSVPKLKQKPLLWFGFFRLGYYILLGYYVCYRALFCITHTASVPASFFLFYLVYFVFIFLLILANCYIFNILTKNSIRRSYQKEFFVLSRIGLVTQCLLPVFYIIARATIRNIGDEFFTASFCDFIRLFVAPAFSVGVWLLFSRAISQIDEVFVEVDSALRERRYQIAYSGSKAYGSKASSVYTPVFSGKATPAIAAKKMPTAEESAPKQQDFADEDMKIVEHKAPVLDALDAAPQAQEPLSEQPEETEMKLSDEVEEQTAPEENETEAAKKPESEQNALERRQAAAQNAARLHESSKKKPAVSGSKSEAVTKIKSSADLDISENSDETQSSVELRRAAQKRATEQAEKAAKKSNKYQSYGKDKRREL